MKKSITRITELAKSYTDDSKTAMEYFDQGNSKFYFQDYNGAIADYTKALEIDPKNTMAYYYRGCAKMLLQDSKGAINDFTKSVEIPLLAKGRYFGDIEIYI